MDEKKIEVTEMQMVIAMFDVFEHGVMKELVNDNPMYVLLAPIICKELWEKLNVEQEDEEDGK